MKNIARNFLWDKFLIKHFHHCTFSIQLPTLINLKSNIISTSICSTSLVIKILFNLTVRSDMTENCFERRLICAFPSSVHKTVKTVEEGGAAAISNFLCHLLLWNCIYMTMTMFVPESIDTSWVLNNNFISIFINVAVLTWTRYYGTFINKYFLTNSFIVSCGLFFEGNSIFLGIGGSKLSVSHVEPLLLQDPGQTVISLELRSRSDSTDEGEGLKKV